MGDQVFRVLQVLSSTVSTLLLEEGKLLGELGQEIQLIGEEFRHIKAFLEAMESNQEDDPRLKVWIDQVREAAYDTEDVLDEFKFLFASQHPHGILGNLHSNLKSIKNLNYPISPSSVQFVASLWLRGRLEKMPPWITSLQNLRHITLVWSGLRDDPLKSLQHLPNLVEVVLRGACEGESLWFKAGGFVKLERLWLRKMKGLRWVRVDEGAIPNIKQLYLNEELPLMEKLPYGVEHLRQLQKLEIAGVSGVLISKMRMEEFKESEEYKRIAHIPQVIIFWEEDGGMVEATALNLIWFHTFLL